MYRNPVYLELLFHAVLSLCFRFSKCRTLSDTVRPIIWQMSVWTKHQRGTSLRLRRIICSCQMISVSHHGMSTSLARLPFILSPEARRLSGSWSRRQKIWSSLRSGAKSTRLGKCTTKTIFLVNSKFRETHNINDADDSKS